MKRFPAEILEAIDLLKMSQGKLMDHERIELWEQIQEGFCPECGQKMELDKDCCCTSSD